MSGCVTAAVVFTVRGWTAESATGWAEVAVSRVERTGLITKVDLFINHTLLLLFFEVHNIFEVVASDVIFGYIMAKRSYDEYCGLAVALDLLGERWTMLIVRELLMGPKRFTDLLAGLPGIGTGLLTQRLRELEVAQVVEKAVLPPPAASSVYQLTADGELLRPTLLGLTRWGLRRLGTPAEGQTVNINLLAFAMSARFNARSSPAADGIYELHVDDSTFQFTIENGGIQIQAGPAQRPQATINTDMSTLIAINNGSCTLNDAVNTRKLVVEGAPEIITKLADAFELDARVAS